MSENWKEDKQNKLEDFLGMHKIKEPDYSEMRVTKRDKNKISELGIYIGLYLLTYIFVLSVCGGFQYLTECQNKLSICGFNMTGFNTIIVTTSYVLTPIIAIIGFLSWKRQHNKQTISQLSKEAYELLSSQNLTAFNYSGYIHSCYDSGDIDDQIRYDLISKTNNTFDVIRLICKITNNKKLERFNENNRTSAIGVIMNCEIRMQNKEPKQNVLKLFLSDYQAYADTMRDIREELSDYILI